MEVKLDRAEAKNAISKGMLKGLQNALESIDRDSSAKVVLVSSAVPRIFCAGADLKVLVWNNDRQAYWSSVQLLKLL